MNRIYFYPKIDYQDAGSSNPYIADFEESLKKHHKIVNRQNNKKGVLDFFPFLFSTDIFLFNWIENLSFRRFGKIQILFFILFLGCCKLLRKKIVWVLHNKYAHDRKNNQWTDLMFYLMMRYSNLILTHSNEGISFTEKKFPEYAKKVKYFIHPIKAPFPRAAEKDKKIDLLIWGTVARYKGIVPFLAYLKEVKPVPELKIWIVGRCFQEDYRAELRSYLTDHVLFKDEFYELEAIAQMAQEARFILFTHQKTTVLSSGVLMDSIRMGTPVMGPDFGAFHDLRKLGVVSTYQNFGEIVDKCHDSTQGDAVDAADLKQFCEENSWEQFAIKLNEVFRVMNKNFN